MNSTTQSEALPPPTQEQIDFLDKAALAVAQGISTGLAVDTVSRFMSPNDMAYRSYDVASSLWDERVRRLQAAGVTAPQPSQS